MTALLEFRDLIKKIYSRNAVFIMPIIKFLIAFLVLNTINGRMGYMSRLDNTALVLIVALMCSFLPAGSIILFSALFTLLHMYELSMEVALVGFCLYLILFLLFMRFSAKDALAVVLMPMLFLMKIPYVLPVAMGLVGTPVSAVSVSCGIIIYYFLSTVIGNAPTISTMGDEASAKIRLMIDGVLNNKAMVVMIIAFSITIAVVYLIRRMSVEYAWTIAMVAGVFINLVILLIGDLVYDTNTSVLQAILGSVVAILIAKVIEFFRFCVDYSRTEKVQFEDDEYYYYVKAIPKMSVSEATNTVKKINTQRSGQSNSATTRRSAYDGAASGVRSVTTERTGRNAGNYDSRRPSSYPGRRPDLSGGQRSVTINSNSLQDEDAEDYEDLF